jgi:RNA polymerase sigma-70 factor (ECF subfamily)
MASNGEQPSVDDVARAARDAWPTIAVPHARFVDYLRERAQRGDPTALHASDLYLACSCVDGVAQGLACFDEHHIRTLPARLRRLDLAATVVEEMQQVLRERLLVARPGHPARIETYTGRGPLHAWVRAAAVRVALNLLRATAREDLSGDDEPPISSVTMSPDRELRHAAYARAITDALREATRELSAEDRLLLQLHFVDGCSAEQIGRTLGINRVTAHRRLVRAYRQIERGGIARLRQRLGLASEDLESVLSITRSRLEISVRALLEDS